VGMMQEHITAMNFLLEVVAVPVRISRGILSPVEGHVPPGKLADCLDTIQVVSRNVYVRSMPPVVICLGGYTAEALAQEIKYANTLG